MTESQEGFVFTNLEATMQAYDEDVDNILLDNENTLDGLFFQMDELRRKDIKLDLDIKTFLLYKRQKRIPRGLRIRKFPSFLVHDMDFIRKWNQILDTCSFALMELLIEFKKEQRKESIDFIKTVQKDLQQFQNDKDFKSYDNKFEANMAKFTKDLWEFKKQKLARDKRDYEFNKVYRWQSGVRGQRPTSSFHRNKVDTQPKQGNSKKVHFAETEYDVVDLDTLLESKMATRIRKPASRSPISRDCALQAGSPRRETKVAVPVFKQREPSGDKWKGVRKSLDFDKPQDRLTASTQTDHRPPDDPPTPERRAALKSGLEALIQAGGLKDLARRDVGQGQYRSKGVLLPQRPQGFRQPRRTEPTRRAHFRDKTLASILKENQPPLREKKTPWVPPNPTSPPASPKRANLGIQKKRLNVSPLRKSENAEEAKFKEPEKELPMAAGSEAVRLAWLDSVTAKRMQELDKLYREEISHLRTLREEVQPLYRLPIGYVPTNQASKQVDSSSLKAANSLVNLDPGSPDKYSEISLQDYNLESMIQRMEEMEAEKMLFSNGRMKCDFCTLDLHAVLSMSPSSFSYKEERHHFGLFL
ncbi:protein moonraker-like [Bombina bombina]|uniref:protein moonraker-like n=1 Tax=Bombina bombina TaxID=8345 RepID=UPI00235AADFE|nr:protein moonraker-like [Bombina bombina]